MSDNHGHHESHGHDNGHHDEHHHEESFVEVINL